MVLVFAAGLLLTLIEIEAMEYGWEKLGIPHRWFFTLLAACLFGSMINLPILRMGDGPEATLVAINVGGALVPSALSIYLVLSRPESATSALIVAGVVSAVSYAIARPMKGVGIAMPILVAPLAAAGASLLLAPSAPAVSAYVGGTLGTLIGADLLNLRRIGTLGAPVVSIGGAGTFDGVFLSGLLAVLLA